MKRNIRETKEKILDALEDKTLVNYKVWNSIMIKSKLHKELMEFKKKHNIKSVGKAIEFLLNNYTTKRGKNEVKTKT